MELGKARLRKVGINNLHCAVHPQHGVIWTDGRAIYLAPLHVEGKQVQNATSVRLGQFENVTSVHWSCVVDGGQACYLCVVHQHNVSVWRVSGLLPKLTFKQIRKINVRPIAQGCLWNPSNDTLALLSRHQCSFYYQHDTSKGSYALPSLESGKISSGCWSTDGKKLVVSIGAALFIYRWSDLNASVSDFVVTAWRVPSLEGEITSISPMPKNCLVVATELPLESLCRKQDSFIVPEVSKEQVSSDMIRPFSQPSATESLMNLQPNSQALKENSSVLTLIKFHEEAKEPTKISSAPLKGVLTPDILLYEKSSQCVVVGSNSQSQLHIYALLDKHLAYCGDIQLDKGQRPKGLCSMPTYFDERGAALLILVGQREGEEESFLSSSVEAEFMVSLKYIIIKPGYGSKSRQRDAKGEIGKSRSMANIRGSNLNKSESMREQRLATLSTGNQARLRSGSTINTTRMSSPLMATSEYSSSSMALSSPPAAVQDNLMSHETKPVRTVAPITEDLTLDILTTSSTKRTNSVQEISNQPPLQPEDLEIERTLFSSQSPQFANNHLTQKYDLNSKESQRDNSRSTKNVKARNSPKSVIRPSDDALYDPHPILIKSSSDLTDDLRVERSHQQHPVVVNSSSNLMGRNDIDSPTGGRSSSDQMLPARHQKGGRETIQEGKEYHQQSPRGYSQDKHVNGEKDDGRRISGVSSLSSPIVVNGQQNGLTPTDVQDETQVQVLKEKGEATSDLGSSRHSADSSFDTMEHQKSNIEALHRRLEELSSTVEECLCVFPNKYQDMTSPELLEIHCLTSKGSDSKKFLLDNGRLQLEPIRLAFNLATVELWLDGIPIVLSSNIDGYIPMKFSSSSVLRITGKPVDK